MRTSLLGDRRVVAHGAAHEVVERRRDLGAGEAAAGDDERQHRAAQVAVALLRGLLEDPDHVVADADGVGERLEGKRVLGQAGDAAKVGDAAERDDELVEGELVRAARDAGGERDRARREVDALDLAHEQPRAAEAAGAAG